MGSLFHREKRKIGHFHSENALRCLASPPDCSWATRTSEKARFYVTTNCKWEISIRSVDNWIRNSWAHGSKSVVAGCNGWNFLIFLLQLDSFFVYWQSWDAKNASTAEDLREVVLWSLSCIFTMVAGGLKC